MLVRLSDLRGRPVVLYFYAVAERYGAWGEKSMYGRTYWGVQRATFVIDPQGEVAHAIPKVSPKTHDENVLAALARL